MRTAPWCVPSACSPRYTGQQAATPTRPLAAERTIRHATAAGDQVTARRFLGLLAISALYGAMPVVEAIATCEEVLSRAQDDRKAIALTELCIGHLEAMRGNFERARLLYRRSRASLEEFGYLLMAALTSLDSSVIELLAGDLTAAESELRTDYRRLEEMGERNYITTTAGLLADVLYRQGRYDESAEFAAVCERLASPDDVALPIPLALRTREAQGPAWGLRRGPGAAVGGDGAHRDLRPA